MATKTPPKGQQALYDEAVANSKAPPAVVDKNIPADFGAPNGTPISNKDLILTDIDRIFGRNKPPGKDLFLKNIADLLFYFLEQTSLHPRHLMTKLLTHQYIDYLYSTRIYLR